MHVPEFLYALLRRPHVEIVKTSLPEWRPCNSVSKQRLLASVGPLSLWQQRAGGALLQNLHRRGWTSDLWFGDEKMNVFWHDHVSHDHKVISLAGLFQNRKKSVAPAHGAQKR